MLGRLLVIVRMLIPNSFSLLGRRLKVGNETSINAYMEYIMALLAL